MSVENFTKPLTRQTKSLDPGQGVEPRATLFISLEHPSEKAPSPRAIEHLE
jgi:hypothetical protein